MSETVIICVSNPLHAEHLIARGATLVKAFAPDSSGIVLHFHEAEDDDENFDKLFSCQLFQSLSTKYGLPFVERSATGGMVAKMIAAFAKEQGGTQLVLTQCPQGRLSSFFHEPLSSQLLKLRTGADLHLLEVEKLQTDDESLFERGRKSWLVAGENGELRMVSEPAPNALVAGIFFQRSDTEFDHGYFVPRPSEEMHAYEVVDCVLVERHAKRLMGRLGVEKQPG